MRVLDNSDSHTKSPMRLIDDSYSHTKSSMRVIDDSDSNTVNEDEEMSDQRPETRASLLHADSHKIQVNLTHEVLPEGRLRGRIYEQHISPLIAFIL